MVFSRMISRYLAGRIRKRGPLRVIPPSDFLLVPGISLPMKFNSCECPSRCICAEDAGLKKFYFLKFLVACDIHGRLSHAQIFLNPPVQEVLRDKLFGINGCRIRIAIQISQLETNPRSTISTMNVVRQIFPGRIVAVRTAVEVRAEAKKEFISKGNPIGSKRVRFPLPIRR